MRASTEKLSRYNSTVSSTATWKLPSMGIIMYRLRVNASGGCETKVTIFGNYILRITSGGKRLEWDAWVDNQFRKQGDSSIVVGSADWTVVMIHYSTTMVTLLENGVQKFSAPWWTTAPPDYLTPGFSVQHLDTQTAVSVDISHVRTLSVSKSARSLVEDLQPALLSYYPLKDGVSDLAVATPALDLVPTTPDYKPSYSPGAFGSAIDFAGAAGCLRIPLYPYGRVFPSYALSVWVKAASYPPPGTDNAGIAGPLSLRPDGRLSYEFVYSSGRDYVTPSVTFVSRNPLPLSTWTSVVVTYAYEESRLAILVGGLLDSVFYTSSDNSSRWAVTPLAGYIGGALRSSSFSSSSSSSSPLAAESPFVMLDGQISDVVLLKTHVHNHAAAAMATRISASSAAGGGGGGGDGGAGGARRRLAIPGFLSEVAVRIHSEDVLAEEEEEVLFFVVPLIIVVLAIAVPAYLYSTIETMTPLPPEAKTLDEIVDNIVRVVDKPAKPDRKCNRDQAGIPKYFPITLDVGGEGLYWNGFVAGFPDAINVNDHDRQFNPDVRHPGQPPAKIPYLVEVESWDKFPPTTLPFSDNFAERICMQSAPLTETNVTEIARVIRPGGVVDLWIDAEAFGKQIDQLARLLNSEVTFPIGANYFTGNYWIEVPAYHTHRAFAGDLNDLVAYEVAEEGYLEHRRIVSHKEDVY
ncbi:hypothetical protein MYCTH_2313136 [Thermothelomyces thermophilus ATCC 42464]|uniref:Uncharacterized protein n=1 Tax=Thermothelomyces thermophilus (strain ATCC 42464 / BCRC 31852 / DSM 1799) TaxID=573729 RepID=G2QNU7_THET4|nr:uncharacterized protein MYCTH_2313136 [Thermothelomyces thermophilus ATCC 42464]AEO62123.1 hypothetical protein MYCTH_2313136 [Thermothelomyces thermophilus ATCC 42464]